MSATFYYDVSSPYAYLSAVRIDDLIPGVVWRPIAFGIVLRETGRIPWSYAEDRSADLDEIDRRAAERGLPSPLRYPPGWPRESYSLAPLRAAVAAERRGRLREFTLALYDLAFTGGRLLDASAIRDGAAAAGLDGEELVAAGEDPDIKATLRTYTDDAMAAGVTGVPTVRVGDTLVYGDDRLEEAARLAAG